MQTTRGKLRNYKEYKLYLSHDAHLFNIIVRKADSLVGYPFSGVEDKKHRDRACHKQV